jgi:hypothetical protein
MRESTHPLFLLEFWNASPATRQLLPALFAVPDVSK